jgi:prefoldin subunit 1
MPNEALQKVCGLLFMRVYCGKNWYLQVLQEISQKKAFAEQQLIIVRQQKAARTREGRMLQLTSSEVSSLPADTKVYEGVGKM